MIRRRFNFIKFFFMFELWFCVFGGFLIEVFVDMFVELVRCKVIECFVICLWNIICKSIYVIMVKNSEIVEWR